MKLIRTALASMALAASLAGAAQAETTLTVHYPMPGFFKDVMDTISQTAPGRHR
ncbi:MAG: hypothetical protein JF625_15240 [Inquilinus limosus]|uniref:C4-dicarboxylate ABC transporter substrate-binding protein n=1 Tax=Inquilinus limosus TaxID=171674 RepID=A0A952FPU5_9PROT|nr:hypothetical protein [Inquilinus limosus]